ncbi:MAG: hypothetical protein ACJ70V_08360 [Nitrososphaera sp.]|jgi:hypothetical protein
MEAINSGLVMIICRLGMLEEIREKISFLVDELNRLEADIADATDIIKDYLIQESRDMPEGKSYFLNGVQTGPVIKSYLLSRKGIEVPGEDLVQIPDFIESVLRFANYPKRKIEVLSDLVAHLQNIHLMNQKAEA